MIKKSYIFNKEHQKARLVNTLITLASVKAAIITVCVQLCNHSLG